MSGTTGENVLFFI